MPSYEYRCQSCDTSFEVRRSIAEPAPRVVTCPDGHQETVRVFSAVAMTVGASGSASAPQPVSASAGPSGGCCGGGCCG